MFDAVVNFIIILIPVAIVIGRIVAGARNKRNPPPAPAQPKIPVHFEDDEDNYFKRNIPAKVTPAKLPATRPRVQATPTTLATLTPAAASGVTPAPGRQAAAAAPSGHKDFTLNLSHLSPLKQAVVMAEILGPPKAME